MRQGLTHLWQSHRKAVLAFLVAVLVMLFFATRMISATVYWMDPARQDQALAGWMTPRYVAQSYQLPPDVVGPALFLAQGTLPRGRSLDSIASDNGVTLAALQARIDAAATAWRANR